MKKSKNLIWIIIIAVVIIGLIFIIPQKGKVRNLDNFTMCIKDSGALFYGAFWCPHCNNQKKEFGDSAYLLPYVECSQPDGKGQLDICKQSGIKGYPTWVFKDGSRQSGEVKLSDLAVRTGCSLP
jgi:hypothetical protein